MMNVWMIVALGLVAGAGGGSLGIAVMTWQHRRGMRNAIDVLRQMDAHQRMLVEADGRSPFWYDYRPRVEDALCLRRGTLDATLMLGNGPVEEV